MGPCSGLLLAAAGCRVASPEDTDDDQQVSMSTEDVVRASRLLDNEIRVLKDELQRTNLETLEGILHHEDSSSKVASVLGMNQYGGVWETVCKST